MRKLLIAALGALAMAVGAGAGEPPLAKHPTAENTAKLILVELNNEPEAVIFVEKDGETFTFPAEDCIESAPCKQLMFDVVKTATLDVLNIHTDPPPGEKHT